MCAMPAGKGPTIAVVGNCQARPLAGIIRLMRPDVTVTEPIIVHLAKPMEEEATMERLETADIIFCQLVADTYNVRFVRSSVLKETFGDRAISWLNLFYRGQNPELTYYRDLHNQHRQYPLGDYHVTTIFDAFMAGLCVTETTRRLADPDFNRTAYGDVAAASLAELRRREVGLTVRIVDDIAERESRERLFFTFNHPSLQLLSDYAWRLLVAADLPPRYSITTGMISEPLSQLIIPPNPATRMPQQQPRTYRGLPRPDETPGRTAPILFTEVEIVERFFAAYELHARANARGFEALP